MVKTDKIMKKAEEEYEYLTGDEEVKRLAELRIRAVRELSGSYHAGLEEATKKAEFHFIIDDSATYTSIADFLSKEAQSSYRKLMQKEKDLNLLKNTLEQKRQEYGNANTAGKKQLEPSILDLEKRIPQLKKEVEALTMETRRLEIERLRK